MIIFMQGCSNHYGYGMLHVLSEIWREKSNMALRAGSGLQTRGVGGGGGGREGGGDIPRWATIVDVVWTLATLGKRQQTTLLSNVKVKQ